MPLIETTSAPTTNPACTLLDSSACLNRGDGLTAPAGSSLLGFRP